MTEQGKAGVGEDRAGEMMWRSGDGLRGPAQHSTCHSPCLLQANATPCFVLEAGSVNDKCCL
jgi:hypothetical protein